jgi:endonuclease/exonuclease/phosphatase family metal-dependent hydrolase
MPLAFAAISLALLAQVSPPPDTLRVLSYNIHHGEGIDGKVDLARLARVIRESKPDLVALQEVDQNVRRSGSVAQTAELAKLTGLHGYFGKQIDYDGGEYGQSILSRFPIEKTSIDWLPGEPDRERRIAVSGRVSVGGRPVTFVTTHLHHISPEFRDRQAAKLNELFGSSGHPVILAGDLNAPPESRPLEILSSTWMLTSPDRSLLTFPAGVPTKKIDFVLALPRVGFRGLREVVPDEKVASDHRPVLVELELPAR